VLHAVGELGEHLVGDVARRLRDEVDAHALGADELDHLDDLVEQLARHVIEEQVRLVEEEYELGLLEVALLRQRVKELREHPQQEHRVDLRALDELGGVEDVHVALPVRGAREPVGEVEVRLAEEDVTALVLDRDELAQNGSHGLA